MLNIDENEDALLTSQVLRNDSHGSVTVSVEWPDGTVLHTSIAGPARIASQRARLVNRVVEALRGALDE